jgi:predicted amidophosphoribosyltransferase
MHVDWRHDLLLRSKHTSTQTRKSRFARFLNVGSAFMLADPAALMNKNVLIVDDVITTGSTLEACATTLLDISGVTVSIAAMAYASQ